MEALPGRGDHTTKGRTRRGASLLNQVGVGEERAGRESDAGGRAQKADSDPVVSETTRLISVSKFRGWKFPSWLSG